MITNYHCNVVTPTQSHSPLFRISMPIMLDDLRIYTDASLPPEQINMIPHSARLGVFVIGIS
jgi:hypothetical protein